MKNVLQVMDYAAPYRGSFIESLDSLDQALKRQGSGLVYVFPPRARSNAAAKWIDEMTENGCMTYFLTGELLKDIRMLRRIIREHRIGIVHTHFENFRTDLAVYFSSLLTGVRRVRHFRNHFPEGASMKKTLKRLVFGGSDFICVSESVCAGIRREFPGNRCHAVDNAIQYRRLDDFTVLNRADYRIPDDSVLCFMMGFDFRRKGVDLAIEALRALRQVIDVRLMISVSSNLEAVRENIARQLGGELPGWIVLVPPRNDVGSYYRMADIFISASREEGFCNALVEAAYCERMVVASKIPAQGDLQIPHAFWFEPGNAADLKARLLEAIERRDSFRLELRRAKAAVERTYDIEAWAQKIVAIYEESGPQDSAPRGTGRAQPV